MGELQRAREELDATADGLQGPVSVGTVLSTGSLDLIAALADFQRSHPNVSVGLQLSAGLLENRVDELLEGRVELILLPIPTRHPMASVSTASRRIQLTPACHG